jgi:uncharacterized protein with HEPN domain
MNGKVRRTTEYLGHMLEAIHRINAYVTGLDRVAFDADTRTQDAVIRNLEVIGEAARNIQQHDPDFVAAHPEVPWALAYRMRNALSHGYADITQLERIQALPRARQRFLADMIEMALQQGGQHG